MATDLSSDLTHVVTLLGAGVVAVPLFKRLGLGSVLGYLAAGLAIGPFGLGLFTEPEAILHVAELGVVMFLFVIGLEMEPSRLWSMRREIFGLGAMQVAVCGALLTGLGVLIGVPTATAFVGGMGFVLSSTAIVMQVLEERGEAHTPRGQRTVSVLLFEDLAIVPLLALVAWLSPLPAEGGTSRLLSVGVGLAALLGLVLAGRFLLSPLFQLLARAEAREVMTGAALLVVLGAALLMQLGGLSMAMGAFLAGVLLSESTFRHQLEADVEPFRGLLLGLFFLGVGMSLDLSVLREEWPLVLVGVLAMRLLKSLGIYLVARLRRETHRDALYRATLLAQGGEFAFVLYGAAASAQLLDARQNAILGAIVIVSMALTPLGIFLFRSAFEEEASLDGVESADDLKAHVLLIGFGRFGQVTSQSLLLRGLDVSIIDTDTEMIRSAGEFGFKVYYGDGSRLDVLRAAGAASASAIAVCIDKREAANKIVALVKAEFPKSRLLVRSFDREHSLHLMSQDVDFQIRETFESALTFGGKALELLGVPESEALEVVAEVRRRDAARFLLEVASGGQAGLAAASKMLVGNAPRPTPFATPQRAAEALNEAAAAALNGAEPG